MQYDNSFFPFFFSHLDKVEFKPLLEIIFLATLIVDLREVHGKDSYGIQWLRAIDGGCGVSDIMQSRDG